MHKTTIFAAVLGLAMAAPALAQQYGAPDQQQQQQTPASAPDITGTWTSQTNGQDGPTETTYGFGQDGTFAQAQQSENGAENRYWGTYTATPSGPGQMQLSLQIKGFLPQVVCVQVPGFDPRCSQQSGPSQMSGNIQFTSANTVQIGGDQFTRDPNPTLLSMQIPQQLTLNGTRPTAPSMTQPTIPSIQQPVDPNDPNINTGNDNTGGGSNCDDLQQQRLCAVNNGHYERSNGCLICVPP